MTLNWFKSTYSNDSANCIEVAKMWCRSSHCGGGECLEVADTVDGMFVRDSKDPAGPVLFFATDSWRNFIADVAAGSFNRPGR